MKQPQNNVEQGNYSSPSAELTAARLAVIASALTTFADAIATLSALIALDSITASEPQDSSRSDDLQQQLKDMQRQIDALTKNTLYTIGD